MASKKKVNQKKLKKTSLFQNEFVNRQITSVFMIALAVFLFTGIKFTAQTGYLGLLLNNILRTLLGDAALVLPFLFAAFALTRLWPLEIENIQYRFWDLLFFFTVDDYIAFNIILGRTGSPRQREHLYLHDLSWLAATGWGLLGPFNRYPFFLFKDIGSYIVIVALSILAYC